MELKCHTLEDSIIFNSSFAFNKFLLHRVKLRLIKATINNHLLSEELDYLINESEQLKKILGSIVTKTNK